MKIVADSVMELTGAERFEIVSSDGIVKKGFCIFGYEVRTNKEKGIGVAGRAGIF